MNRRAPWVLFAIAAVCLILATSVNAAPSTPRAAPASTQTAPTSSTRAVQTALRSYGYGIAVDGVYGPQTTRAVRHWQRANGLLIDGIAGPITQASLGIGGPAPAVRVDPPEPPGLNGLSIAPAGLDACAEMNYYRTQFGLPDQFSDQPRTGPRSGWGYGWRESNCRNDVTSLTGCCHGYWQNYLSSHLSGQSAYRARIIDECQVTQVSDIKGTSALSKQKQSCVTAVVFQISGLSPWRL